MKCPVDKQDMIVVEHHRIELDYCLKCSGVWFDARELDLLVAVLKSELSGLSEGQLLTPQPAEVAEDQHRCPICRRKLDKVWLGKEPRVLIDSCPNGDGLWFDGGELNDVLCQIPSSGRATAKDIMAFLGGAFTAACQPKQEELKPPPSLGKR